VLCRVGAELDVLRQEYPTQIGRVGNYAPGTSSDSLMLVSSMHGLLASLFCNPSINSYLTTKQPGCGKGACRDTMQVFPINEHSLCLVMPHSTCYQQDSCVQYGAQEEGNYHCSD
jgi:hypothetical protein